MRRFMKLGGLAASVTGSMVTRSITSRFSRDREATITAGLVSDAQKVARTMGELKGVAMKLGQTLSMAPDQLPEEVRREFALLQRNAPPMPYEMVAAQFEAGTGIPIREAFIEFEPEAVGAASIGQVHRARTFDGRNVAVKVQYPDILESLDADVRNLDVLTSMGRLLADREMIDKSIEEVREAMLAEANYAQEADNIRAAQAAFEGRDDIVMPRVVDELSSDTVLTMEYIEGVKLDDAMAEMSPSERNEVGLRFSTLFTWMFHERQLLHADPHPGNFLYTPDGRIGMLDFGCLKTYDEAFTDNWLRVAVAKWTGNGHRLRSLFDELGFRAQKGSAGLSNAQLEELVDITSAPLVRDVEFDWGAFKPRVALQAFTARNLAVIQYVSPPEAIFYFRVAAGVWGLLNRHKVKANCHRAVRAIAEARGLL